MLPSLFRGVRGVGLAVLVAAAAPGALAQSLLQNVEPAVTEFTLDNGMTFVVVERHDAPVVSFYTYAAVGGVDEPVGQTGVAHMFEHMAFKGTRTLGSTDIRSELAALTAEEAAYDRLRQAQFSGAPAAEVAALQTQFVTLRDSAKTFVEEAAFDNVISRNGAVGLNATTNYDRTAYFYSLPANKIELWFATESDRFADPVLREFYQERDVVMEERRLRTESSPVGRLLEEFITTAFKAHPYGRPVVGYMSDLQNLSRTEAEAFFRKYYTVDNLTVAIVGDVDPAAVRQLAERYFGPLESGGEPDPVRTVEPEQLGERRVTLVEQTQPILLLGYHRPSVTSPDDAAYTVLADVLGAGRTSRLYRALVDTEQALAAVAAPAPFGSRYPTLFLIQGVPNRGVSIDSVETAIFRVLDDLAASGPTEAELNRAKTRARAGLASSLESNTGLAGQLAETQALTGDWRDLFRELDAIQAVTAADVQRVARETFTMKNRTVAVLRTAADS